MHSLESEAAVEPRTNQRPKKTIVATNSTAANSEGSVVSGVPFQAHESDSALHIPRRYIIETNDRNASISLVHSFESEAAVEPRTNKRPKKTTVAANSTMANAQGSGVSDVPFQAHESNSALHIPR